jgi:hypothetical protein
LGGEIEVALNIGGVDDIDDKVRFRERRKSRVTCSSRLEAVRE